MEVIKGFIDWLFSTSLNGSVLIGIILLVKAGLDRKIGVQGHYYIWLLLIIRMVMPFSPQCFTSVYNLLNLNKDRTIITGNTYHGQEYGFIEEPVLDKFLFSESFLHSTDFKIMVIWLVGVLVFSIITVRVNFQFWQRIKASSHKASQEIYYLLERCKVTMKINKEIDIFFTDVVDAPTLAGLFNVKILIPSYMEGRLTYEQYQHVFLHELAHFKRKDIHIFSLIGIIQILHWFNPILWFGFVKMRQDCEIACDSLVLSYLNEGEYKSYGETIIHMLQNFKSSFQPVVTVGVLGNRGEIKRRIKMISNYKKNSYRLSIMALIIFVALGFAFLTSATKAAESDMEELSNQENRIEMQWPVQDYTQVINPYGSRMNPVTKKEYYHTGIDIPAPEGVDIMASAKGEVIFAGWLEGYGETVIIDHGQGITTLYGHCSAYLVEKDTKVKSGEIIAKIGSTGMSTGSQLHFEIRKNEEPVDPLKEFQPNQL